MKTPEYIVMTVTVIEQLKRFVTFAMMSLKILNTQPWFQKIAIFTQIVWLALYVSNLGAKAKK